MSYRWVKQWFEADKWNILLTNWKCHTVAAKYIVCAY